MGISCFLTPHRKTSSTCRLLSPSPPCSVLPLACPLPLATLLSQPMTSLPSMPTSMAWLMTTVEPSLVRMRRETATPPVDPTEWLFLTAGPRWSTTTLLMSAMREFPTTDLPLSMLSMLLSMLLLLLMPSLPNQNYQTKPTKPNLPNQTYQTKPTKSKLPNQTYQ